MANELPPHQHGRQRNDHQQRRTPISFTNSSTAGTATITNSRHDDFNDTSSAGDASITNNGSAADLQRYQLGRQRHHRQQRGTAAISTTRARPAAPPSRTTLALQFHDSSTAGSATITNNGMRIFYGTSTAGSATITNNVGLIQFRDTSTAGSATITNTGSLSFTHQHGRQRRHYQQLAALQFLRHEHGRQRHHHQQRSAAAVLRRQHGRQRHHHQQPASSFQRHSTAGSAGITNNDGTRISSAAARPAAPPSPTTAPVLQHQHGRQRQHHQYCGWISSTPARPAAPPSPTTTVP